MNKILQSPWTAGVIGMLVFLLMFVAVISKVKITRPQPATDDNSEPPTAWTFRNPEMDTLMEELRTKKAALDKRENDLNLLAIRLKGEQEQIEAITQSVTRIQQQFDKNILHIQEAELSNIKKLIKTYAGMDPEEAANVLKTMDLDTASRILRFMKESQSTAILKAMSKNEADARKAAMILDRIRLSVIDPATNSSTSKATPTL